MKGTANSSIQQECGEMPLSLRRQELRLKTAVKLTVSTDNPAKSVLTESWEHYYGKYKKGQEPMLSQVIDYIEKELITDKVQKLKTQTEPPWLDKTIKVNLNLHGQINKTNNEIHGKTMALELINTFNDFTHIYTDGSSTAEDKISSGFCVPSHNIQCVHRITAHSTIFTAELTAIKLAIEWIKTATSGRYVIFSDSLSSLLALNATDINQTSRPNLIQEIKTEIQVISKTSEIQLAWIPSHVGIKGNELADMLAKEATKHDQVSTEVKHEFKDASHKIRHHITGLWQQQYDKEQTGAWYKRLDKIR